MGVYNGGRELHRTLDSVLSQEAIALELIVVDDGSDDDTAAVLSKFAAGDARVRILRQDNRGLTEALAAGCLQAKGRYIARQDCGDVSLPCRLFRLRDMLDTNSDAVMATCGTQFFGPGGEFLYTVAPTSEELQAGLRRLEVTKVRGPSHHGNTMFRRLAYEQVGGYRAAFPVAQDLDLWMRLSEIGKCIAETEVLYGATWAVGAISATKRKEQIRTTKVILACADARRSGQDEANVLRQWMDKKARSSRSPASHRPNAHTNEQARFYYFIASVLRHSKPARSRHYYIKAIRSRFLFPRAWLSLLRLVIFR